MDGIAVDVRTVHIVLAFSREGYTPLALIKPPPDLVHFPQERPVARAVDRSEVVNVPPEVVVRRKSRRRELRFERRIVELETRKPVGNNEIKLLETKQKRFLVSKVR